MKTKNKRAIYKIDSCHEKFKFLTHNVCNKPSYHTVCYRPIVDRSLLTHSDHLKILSTPRGFKWTDMPLHYKKAYKSYKLRKLENEKYNIYGRQKMNYEKGYNVQNKTINNQKQKKINDTLNLNNEYNKSKKLQNQQKNISKNDKTMANNADKTKIKNIISINNNYGKGDDLKNKNDLLIQSDEDSSSEKLKILKDQQEADYFMEKKKKLWLQAEKKRKKREEEENKFKLFIQAKQKENGEQKKNMEEKIKIKLKRNQLLEKQRKQKIENENKDMAKAQLIAEKKKLKENDILSKETEKQRKLEALEKEAIRIEEEEEAWRKKINQEFAQKMGYPMNSNIANKKNKVSMCNNANNGNKRLTQYTDQLLKELRQNNQVFDPGNLMKQIIKRELNKAEKKKVKQKSQLRVCEQCNKKKNNTIVIKTEEKKEKPDLLKKIVFKKYYGLNNIIDSKNSKRENCLSVVKSHEHCIINKPEKMLKCKIPNVHSYRNSSFNTLVCNWKNEVADMITNMQKRRYNCTK